VRRILPLQIACLLAGCGAVAGSFSQTQTIAGSRTTGESRSAMEEELRATAIRFQFGRFDDVIGYEVARYYLSCVRAREMWASPEPPRPRGTFPPPLRGADPSAAFMARFVEHDPPVAGISRCTDEGTASIHDRATGENGCVFWTGSVEWLDEDTADVEAGIDMGRRFGEELVYRLQREDGRWTVERSRLLRAWGSR
jgi:hypothetical protein